MENTSLIIPDKIISKSQESTYRKLAREHREHELTMQGIDLAKSIITNPVFSMVSGWLIIEQLNKHQAFGRTQELSDWSASVLEVGLLSAGLFGVAGDTGLLSKII